MNILALKSILCNSKRSLHVVIAVALCVSIIYSSFVVADGFVRRVESMTGGYTLTNLFFIVDDDVTTLESSIPDLVLESLTGIDTQGVIQCEVKIDNEVFDIWGVDFEKFRTVRSLRITGHVPDAKDEILIGSKLAEIYGVGVGSTVVVSRGGDYEFIISGILSSSGQFDYGFVSSLETARVLRPDLMNSFSFLEIKSDEPSKVQDDLDLTEFNLKLVQGLGMQDYLLGLAKEVKRDLYLVSIVIASLSLVSVAHTMFKILGDSMQDLLVLRSLGITRRGLIQTIIADSIILSLFGGIFGLILGNVFANAASLFSFLVLRTVFLPIKYDPLLFLYCISVSLIVGILGGLVSTLLKRPVKEAYGALKSV
jgi:ABC-type lipoprotein release transport system permease subunit